MCTLRITNEIYIVFYSFIYSFLFCEMEQEFGHCLKHC